MLHEDTLAGVITIFRQEVREFTKEQVSLLEDFAAQAVIAIENAAGLLSELGARGGAGSGGERRSVPGGGVTSRIIQQFSRKRSELWSQCLRQCWRARSTLAMLSSATSTVRKAMVIFLCKTSLLTGFFAPAAFVQGAQEFAVFYLWPEPPIPVAVEMMKTKTIVHIVDVAETDAYAQREPITVASVELGNTRTLMIVRMLKDNELVGAFTLARQEVRPFSDEQIELVSNFAAQAVIAIENARLLKELRERTDEVVKLNQQLEQRVTDQVDEIERMSRLRRFLPPQVADLIVASGSEKQLESHRREITALFCDLRGFTGFTESADAEDVMALLRDYHAAIGEIIIKYHGTLERYAGDGVGGLQRSGAG